ncbi:conserved hypothetical protein [Vibrio jasicida]|uniref:hypothetical protein n=1 Tax=Vibrio jasicida TaxID=766224 RepID=UPI002895A909|nr:conserved hypothetical protein [Vibrio jasicida]
MKSFHSFLNGTVLKKINRKELLVKLQLSEEQFKGVDEVTMSRWVNGVTQPRRYRQLAIAYISDCIDEYIEQQTIQKLSASTNSTYLSYFSRLDERYHSLFKKKNEDADILNLQHSDIISSSDKYYFYVSALPRVKIILDCIFDAKIKLYNSLFFISRKSNVQSFVNLIYGHDSIFELKELKKQQISAEPSKIAICMAYFESSNHAIILWGMVNNYLINNHVGEKDITIYFRGGEGLGLAMALGGQELFYLKGDDTSCNIYAFKYDMKKYLSHPIVMNSIINYNSKHKNDF